ncbi:hypothetical protein [Legionella gresilensis]|uniref:hypothetical protein n=1 Tax=Legionella gresilensis TaxID=91823 RepID=UPI001040E5F3|nr:hypothetical protein [Legionella gresilensis]
MSKAVYIFGDSHANTFLRGKELIEKSIKGVTFHIRPIAAGKIVDEFVFQNSKNQLIINPVLTIALSKDGLYPKATFDKTILKYDQVKLCILLGTGLPHRLLVNGNSIRRRYFEYFIVREKKQDYQTVPLLKDMLKDELRKWQISFFKGLDLLKEQGFNDITLLASPPLHRDYNYLFEKVSFLEPLAKEKGLEPKFCFASDYLRQFLYNLSEQIIEEKAKELNYQYISNPKGVMDKQGFLRPKYNYDGVHANVHYALDFAKYIAQGV